MFIDRQDAGEQLAVALMQFKDDNPIILALPRGGVPIGRIVADALNAPLDVLLVRKISAPGQPELAIGAITSNGKPTLFIDKEIAPLVGANEEYIESQINRKLKEIAQRKQMYGNVRSNLSLKDRTVIVVDDGIATGSTAQVALQSLRTAKPKSLILATPLAPRETITKLQRYADEIICLVTPSPFYAIGSHYHNFDQVSDSEVVETLDNK